MDKNVIYIAGSSRSGSTFLDGYIGQYKDVTSIGEIRHIMQRAFIWDEYCSCGKFFSKCDFWRPIREEFLKYFDPVEVLKVKKELESPIAYLKFFLRGEINKELLEKYRKAYLFIIDKVFEVTNSRFIVDSSKVAFFANQIYRDSDYKIHYVHITREAPGVIYSMSKRKIRVEKNPYNHESPKYMRRFLKPIGLVYWMVRNYESVIVSEKFKNTYFINYRDLGNKELMLKLLREIGVNSIRKKTYKFHIISGNPSRFDKKFLNFKYDDKWKKNLNKFEKFFYTYAAKPLEKVISDREKLFKGDNRFL